jgi:hypothetical protein
VRAKQRGVDVKLIADRITGAGSTPSCMPVSRSG